MFLQVCAGFANRLRATVSGICGAEDLNLPLVISWPVEWACAATFTDLFEPVPHVEFCSSLNNRARMCLSPADWEQERGRGEIVIKSYGQFHQSDPARWRRVLQSLRPRLEFLERVRSCDVGIHIRRTDNRTSCEKSPTAVFIAEMRKYPNDTTFFVATDDVREWDALVSAFSEERLIRVTTDYSRNTLEGIHAAFVDFLCLASCGEILGSAGSSFSEMAAAYGTKALRIIKPTV